MSDVLGSIPGRCKACGHTARGSCSLCGGYLGHPALGLPPCPACPDGREVGVMPPPPEPNPTTGLVGWEMPPTTVYVQPPHWPTYYPDEPLPPGPAESTPYSFPDWIPPA